MLLSILFTIVFTVAAVVIGFNGKQKTIGFISSIFINLYLPFATLPTINFGFFGWPLILLLNGILLWLISLEYDYDIEHNKNSIFGIVTMIVVLLYLLLTSIISSSAIIHHAEYRSLIGEIKEGQFSTDTSPLDISEMRTVDEDLAWQLADKRLGEDIALGSRVEVGKMNIQKVGNKLYWVAPLNHSGFWKWWNSEKGTPGYVIVSATNDRDVRLVQEIDGEPLFIKYNMGAYWGDDPKRYLYNNGYSTTGYTDWTFEIDDNGKPYYVVTKYEREVGYGGKNAVGIIILDVQTGEITEKSIAVAPDWVDRIQPEDFVTNQLNDWGKYVHGPFNWSNQDELKVTEGMSLVYGDDGKAYWYTGITSMGADEGTVGFVLVNTRTKETKIYYQAGATETAAMRSAEGAVQEKKYVATFPVLYNVSGLPTYFMTLKDNAGLVKMYAFVSVENYSIVGVGNSVQEALRNYRKNTLSKGNAITPDTIVESYKVRGRVLRKEVDPGRNSSTYYFLISNHENKLFVCSPELSSEVIITAPGDEVEMSFEDGGNEVVDVSAFDNLNIKLQKTAEQVQKEDDFEATEQISKQKIAEKNANAAWEELTPEEKKQLLDKKKK